MKASAFNANMMREIQKFLKLLFLPIGGGERTMRKKKKYLRIAEKKQ